MPTVNELIVGGIAFYIASAFFTYLISVAYFQKEYALIADEHLWDDRKNAIKFAMFGPIGLFVLFITTDGVKHGLKF